MSGILLKKKNKAYYDQKHYETIHTISESLFLDALDIESDDQCSKRKEKSYRIDEIEFVPLTIRME
jgi:hypothetical protein